MKCEERRGANGDGDLVDASGAEEQRPESANEPVVPRQAGRPPATTPKDDELLLEPEILAITDRTPPWPHSFAATTARWTRMSSESFMRESA